MENADKIDERIWPYLFEIGYEKWSIAYSNVNRSMVMTSDIAESLNSANRVTRELPVKKLLQFMMDLEMKWNNGNRMNAQTTFTELKNKYNTIIRENLFLSDKIKVDRITCPPAMVVLSYTHMNVQSYCASYYTKKNYLKANEFSVIPLPDESMCHIPTKVLDIIVLPPIWKLRPGRPKNSNRGKGIMDYMSAQKVSCGWCGKVGHNQRTCTNAPIRI
ncbi:hypothetical protein CQW23_17498 [Capsicum baccatum]|uniref:CCHC-type domain-containing protein n=1 Tax=Capsicum baccatum TaxID=33114 RepID=A0A2G2WDZ2_CAPBA|nr:hypothetical protein CQW23_17498 [Capsicum baccatum]